MNKTVSIGNTAPELIVSQWVQGDAIDFSQLTGRVILIEVFQLNCPGCFLYSLPQAIDLHQRYADKGLIVIAVATAFEDFELNTLDNLKLLLEQHLPIAETKKLLAAQNRLIDGRLPYHLPFPVAMDKINKQPGQILDSDIEEFSQQHIADFSKRPKSEKMQIRAQVLKLFQAKLYKAETFNLYRLQGTPSHLVIDKKGILIASEFGHFSELEWLISNLLTEN